MIINTVQTIGYYSLIQYCPHPIRMEAANLGVILFVPEPHFIEAHINPNNIRARHFFGHTFDNNWLHAAKESIKARLKISGKNFRTLEDFKRFINTRANEIQLTQPSPTIVEIETPHKKLESLFHQLAE